MKNQLSGLLANVRRYPISCISFSISLAIWLMVISIKVRMWLKPPVLSGEHLATGEGMMYGVLMATMVSSILLLVTLVNLTIYKQRDFYAKLLGQILISTLLFYGVLGIS